MGLTESQITKLLQDWSNGDAEALEQLLPLVMDDLRGIARRFLNGERHPHTQPSGLVNEVCLRLLQWQKVSWDNRQQFFSFAAVLMRRIIVDAARARHAAKRGEGFHVVTLSGAKDRQASTPTVYDPESVIDLDDALRRFAEIDKRASKMVELRFFVGLTAAEVATVLGIARATVTRDWTMAKRWLARELSTKLPVG